MRKYLILNGAGETNRTPDLLITNQLLYQLSYTGRSWQVYGALGGGNNQSPARRPG